MENNIIKDDIKDNIIKGDIKDEIEFLCNYKKDKNIVSFVKLNEDLYKIKHITDFDFLQYTIEKISHDKYIAMTTLAGLNNKIDKFIYIDAAINIMIAYVNKISRENNFIVKENSDIKILEDKMDTFLNKFLYSQTFIDKYNNKFYINYHDISHGVEEEDYDGIKNSLNLTMHIIYLDKEEYNKYDTIYYNLNFRKRRD